VSAARSTAGGALLVVVPDRDLQCRTERVEDTEALRLGDVLEVDRAEGRLERLHDLHDLLRVADAQADRDGIDAAEVFEEQRLPLHHRKPRLGTDVA
jgi:hypothetical protein